MSDSTMCNLIGSRTCGRQIEVTFEEACTRLSMETQREWPPSIRAYQTGDSRAVLDPDAGGKVF